MSERVKKILVIVLFVGSVFAIGAGLYFVFFRPTPPPPTVTPPGEELPPGTLPGTTPGGPRPGVPAGGAAGELPDTVARGGVTVTTTLTTSAIENPTVSADGKNINFYDPADGRFYSIDAAGKVVQLSDQTFPQVEHVAWSKDADKAVLEFPDGSNVVYDFGTKRQVTLPTHWEDFQFSPVSDKLAAKSIALDPNNRWLVVSNADGSNVRPFQPLGLNADKVRVSWSPNNQVVAFADTAGVVEGGLDRKMILPVGLNNENFKGLVVEGYGFEPLWSPDGKRLLYSVAGDYSSLKPLLWVADATPGTMGENRRSLGLNTWADKCAFASSTAIYCAVPQGLPDNAGLQPSLFNALPDILYKIDLASGRSTIAAVPESSRTMLNLSVTADESALFYTDAATGRLETIQLK